MFIPKATLTSIEKFLFMKELGLTENDLLKIFEMAEAARLVGN